MATVVGNRRLSTEYNGLSLQAPDLARLAAPGQFLMVKAGSGHDPLLRRPFSIFEVLRDAEGVSILSKRVGRSSGLLYDARPGDTLRCLGPLGRPFTLVDPPSEAWMVAGGVGLAPFWTLAAALAARGTATRLFYGARSGAELFYLEHFAGLGTRLHLTTEDGSLGEAGRVTAPLERELAGRPANAPLTLYACGPEPMLAAVSRLATRFARPVEVSVERLMGCGMGGCYSCVVPLRDESGQPHLVRSCVEGPVLPGDRIAWD